MLLLSSADFFQMNFFEKNFRNTISVSDGLNDRPDQDRPSVTPDLGSKCLQRSSADDNSRRMERVMVNPRSQEWYLLYINIEGPATRW